MKQTENLTDDYLLSCRLKLGETIRKIKSEFLKFFSQNIYLIKQSTK